ncbi:pantetheine-phosphate adenylyltransferase [Microvenator marinus]|jgi:pantetheine-phosphate adenylyltransferase|uniref:Phosphopantetheine adenylyltransferase n=1 Tax=Microvenator marinus TaxID=2600177 RepID=A0A5B8XRT1_9DELT|nr:pantetheine-phosphate adenylyltransferase [Microvenator marinus]QED27877.1 pantetheine-phosphate adenylyltransferase [Microvenator marinus]
MSQLAIYPGSFDPLTNGHVSIVERGLEVFDRIIVAVAHNVRKSSALFTVEERVEFIRQSFPEDRVEIDTFTQTLLVDYARQRGCKVILRGLRAVSDFEYELQLANMNRRLAPDIETVFMMTEEAHFYVSSSLIKEVALFGGDVTGMVPPHVAKRLHDKFLERG